MKKLYRKIFYHWRAKYLCGWLDLHRPSSGNDMNVVTSYVCIDCGRCRENPAGMRNDQRIADELKDTLYCPASGYAIKESGRCFCMFHQGKSIYGKGTD